MGDAVVLFDDVALMVQIKAQFSRRDPLLWARKELKKAAKQLRHTNRMLFGGHVRELEDPLFGKVPFNPCGCPENADGNACFRRRWSALTCYAIFIMRGWAVGPCQLLKT